MYSLDVLGTCSLVQAGRGWVGRQVYLVELLSLQAEDMWLPHRSSTWLSDAQKDAQERSLDKWASTEAAACSVLSSDLVTHPVATLTLVLAIWIAWGYGEAKVKGVDLWVHQRRETTMLPSWAWSPLPNGHYLGGKLDADCCQQHAKPKAKAALDTCSAWKGGGRTAHEETYAYIHPIRQ